MFNKKAQGEIITTVLIILLVLAAIVIVWQVVNSTIKKGGEAVTTQSECLGFTIALSEDNPTLATTTINAIPSKNVASLIVYKNGAQLGTPAATNMGAVYNTGAGNTATTGDVITSAGIVGTAPNTVLCNGMNSITV